MALHRTTLSNGLKLVHNYNPSAQSITLNVLYGVGSKHEEPTKTGLAHLLEHLMFSNKDLSTSFEATLEEIGARCNAFTCCDYTNYYTSIPADKIEIAFKLESDRMRECKFTEDVFKAEHMVVLEEFRNKLNAPYGNIQFIIKELAYKKHPYRWNTIGKSIDQVSKLTFQDVCDFYNKFYSPGNAIVVVSGDIKWKDTLYLTNKWFGNIKRRDTTKNKLPKESNRKRKECILTKEKIPANTIVKLYPICGIYGKDFHVYDLITDLLSANKSSRLTNELVYKKQIFTSIDSYVGSEIDYSLVNIVGVLKDGIDFKVAENAIIEELAKLYTEKCTEEELNQYKQKHITIKNIEITNNENLAADIARDEYAKKPSYYLKQQSLLEKITSDDIKRYAELLFKDDKSYTIKIEKE